jgi:hypothetical protein
MIIFFWLIQLFSTDRLPKTSWDTRVLYEGLLYALGFLTPRARPHKVRSKPGTPDGGKILQAFPRHNFAKK